MIETLSVLAAQRAKDNDLCERLRSETIIAEHEHPAVTIEWPDGRVEEYGPSVSHTVTIRNPDGAEAAIRIEQLSQELAEASHDRDRYHADLERLREKYIDLVKAVGDSYAANAARKFVAMQPMPPGLITD